VRGQHGALRSARVVRLRHSMQERVEQRGCMPYGVVERVVAALRRQGGWDQVEFDYVIVAGGRPGACSQGT
jgi:hypothetical protein